MAKKVKRIGGDTNRSLSKYLEEIGIEPERLEMVMVSAGMGHRFAETATKITAKIRELGPSPVKAAPAL